MWQKAKNKFTFDLLNPFRSVNITYNNQREGDCNMAAQQNYTPELTATIIEQLYLLINDNLFKCINSNYYIFYLFQYQ